MQIADEIVKQPLEVPASPPKLPQNTIVVSAALVEKLTKLPVPSSQQENISKDPSYTKLEPLIEEYNTLLDAVKTKQTRLEKAHSLIRSNTLQKILEIAGKVCIATAVTLYAISGAMLAASPMVGFFLALAEIDITGTAVGTYFIIATACAAGFLALGIIGAIAGALATKLSDRQRHFSTLEQEHKMELSALQKFFDENKYHELIENASHYCDDEVTASPDLSGDRYRYAVELNNKISTNEYARVTLA